MKTQDIKNIALALKDIREGAMKRGKDLDTYRKEPPKKEDNSNDVSDDGEGLDKVQPKAVKKKFKDRKDKDIDNDGDTDSSDKFLHKRRKAVSKAIASKKKPSAEKDADVEVQEAKLMSRDDVAKMVAKKLGNPTKQDRYDTIAAIKSVLNKSPNQKSLATDREFIDDVLDTLFKKYKFREMKEAATQKPNNGADAEDGLSPNGKKMMAMKTDAPEGADITKVAPKTFAAMRASGKKAAMRNNDNPQGDKTPPKNDGK